MLSVFRIAFAFVLLPLVACDGWAINNQYCQGEGYSHSEPSCDRGYHAECEGSCHDDSGDENYYGCKCAPDDGGHD